MSLFLNVCTHSDTTEPDQDGKAICTGCGATIQARLTLGLLLDTFEMVRRDYGLGYRHSMRCVDTPEGWCCADDCTLGQRGGTSR